MDARELLAQGAGETAECGRRDLTIRRLGPGDEEIVVRLGGERIATALMRDLVQISRQQRIRTGSVLTNSSNEPAMSFYRSLGGARPNEDDAMWEFDYPA
jgi:hypothetical protein